MLDNIYTLNIGPFHVYFTTENKNNQEASAEESRLHDCFGAKLKFEVNIRISEVWN